MIRMHRCSCRLVALLVVCCTAACSAPAEDDPQVSPVDLVDSGRVDFHTHVFNTHYLPIEGILRQRGLSQGVARAVHRWLSKRTCQNEALSTMLQIGPESLEVELSAEGATKETFAAEVRAIIGQDSASLVAPAENDEREMMELVELLLQTSFEPDAAVEASDEELDAEDVAALGIPGAFRFLNTIRRCEQQQFEQLVKDYPASLYVLHMMDLEHIFQYQDSVAPTYPLAEQWTRMADLVNNLNSQSQQAVLLAAFDPFRFSHQGSLDALKDLPEAAIGLKFYPPSGYRPTGTTLPPDALDPPATSRYSHLALESTVLKWQQTFTDKIGLTQDEIDALVGDAPAVLDSINKVFFQWAAEQNKLIFSHQTPGGFEAGPGYGKLFADPRWWYPILQKNPSLRLVLAHSGRDGWFDDEAEWSNSFGYNAYRLCVLFENVHCDFGYFDQVRSKSKRARFEQRLADLLSRESVNSAELLPQTFENTHDLHPRYDFSKKILFGTDWFMVKKRRRFKKIPGDLEKVFSSPELAPYKDDFFGRNARRALQL